MRTAPRPLSPGRANRIVGTAVAIEIADPDQRSPEPRARGRALMFAHQSAAAARVDERGPCALGQVARSTDQEVG